MPFEKFGQIPRAFNPYGLGQKSLFLDRLRTLSEHISATEDGINNWKEICQSTGTPLPASKFGELKLRNG